MRSLYGPQVSLKCVVSNLADGPVPTSSALRVIDQLSVEHPAATLLLEACEAMHAAHGCGITTLICLAAELATEAVLLIESGFATHAVLGELRWAMPRAAASLERACEKAAAPIEFPPARLCMQSAPAIDAIIPTCLAAAVAALAAVVATWRAAPIDRVDADDVHGFSRTTRHQRTVQAVRCSRRTLTVPLLSCAPSGRRCHQSERSCSVAEPRGVRFRGPSVAD